ncbi:MAG: class I mannose-6-phosphate isomerase [Candidatus Andeanibacterium colombiense]|uniref:Class I mannose-6-phosphate isomerase n=1 Tax=Candidatus Andeanibacterium colombiense TaxID=3121345 RepID=A0AAJ6BNQ2_9SPHN|nr:MAG: class I mannose-6-phosphate isomerase [Sphingomonadaceae bacterium]
MSALLSIRRVEKPWGADVLPPPFAAAEGERIGEIWFEPPQGLDALLVKYLFTSDKLSVQVHPGGASGKEECWLVLDAEPGAVLGVGFLGEYGTEDMRAAALDGSIEQMLYWHPVTAGDFVYLPAGTVHAIGGGISLVEVQQNNDVTYRFYDYGRPRELHLDEALAVAEGAPHNPALRSKLPGTGHLSLVSGPWFRLDRADGPPDADMAARYQGPLLAIPLSGSVTVAGEAVPPGECAAASSIDEIAIAQGARCLLTQPCG